MKNKTKRFIIKSPIAQRLSWAFVSIYTVMIIVFTISAFYITEKILLSIEKNKADDTIAYITHRLSSATVPYNLERLASTIYRHDSTDRVLEQEGNYYFARTERDVTNMLYSNQNVYVYGEGHKLLFTTDESEVLLSHIDTDEDVIELTHDGHKGLLVSKELYSDLNGRWIGAVQIFHDLDYYYEMQQRIFLIITLLQVVGFGLGFLLLNYITKRFFRPAQSLYQVMKHISEEPDNLSLRSNIRTSDEFEVLSRIFDSMLDRLEEYAQLQSRFISDVSHELRTPIAVIQGHLGLLKRWGKNDPEVLEESLEASYHEADRMSLVVNEMLDMIRLQGSFEQYKNEVTEVKEIIRLVIDNFKVLHPDFTFSIKGNLMDLKARIYKNHLEQAVTIILDNAIKYSPKRKEISIELCQCFNEMILFVEDKGEGISEDDLKHIFERFYRTDRSRNRLTTKSGLGIGLSILQQIVISYDGRIDITSELGEGTTVALYFPLVEDE